MSTEKTVELKPFDGATHAIVADRGGKVAIVEFVKCTHWIKDGDHPLVERYPVEGRRDFKGTIRINSKTRWSLRFGEWIVERANGDLWTVNRQDLPAEYVPLKDVPASAFQVAVAVLLAVLVALFAPDGNVPLMLAVTHLMYYTSLLAQWNGSSNIFDLDEANDDMQVSIHTNTYSVNQDTHDFFDDVTNEVSGTNYTAGGSNIDSQTVSRSTGTVTFDGNDVVWLQSGAGFSNGRKFVLYRNTGTPSTSRLYSVVTADNDVGNVTGDLTLQFHSSGISNWSTT